MPKEIRNLDVRSFWRKIRESRLLHQWVCLCKHASGHGSAASRSVFIVERTYVFTQSRQLHTADGRRPTWWVFLLKRWDLWICLEIVSGQVHWITRTTKKQCIKILKECCGSNFSFPLSATNRAGWSIGPICHHRHLIHDTFKRQINIPNDFTNHYTDNEPAVSQELPVMLLHPL